MYYIYFSFLPQSFILQITSLSPFDIIFSLISKFFSSLAVVIMYFIQLQNSVEIIWCFKFSLPVVCLTAVYCKPTSFVIKYWSILFIDFVTLKSALRDQVLGGRRNSFETRHRVSYFFIIVHRACQCAQMTEPTLSNYILFLLRFLILVQKKFYFKLTIHDSVKHNLYTFHSFNTLRLSLVKLGDFFVLSIYDIFAKTSQAVYPSVTFIAKILLGLVKNAFVPLKH